MTKGELVQVVTGFFVGNLIYRLFRSGTFSWETIADSAAVALIGAGIVSGVAWLRRGKG